MSIKETPSRPAADDIVGYGVPNGPRWSMTLNDEFTVHTTAATSKEVGIMTITPLARSGADHRCRLCGRAETVESLAGRERRNRDQYSRWVLGDAEFTAWHTSLVPAFRDRIQADVDARYCSDPSRACGGAADRTYWYWEQMLRVFSARSYQPAGGAGLQTP